MSTSDVVALIIGVLGFVSGVAAIVNSNFKRFTAERLYERELEVLGKIHKHLMNVSTYSKLLTKSVFFPGESREKYQTDLRDSLNQAYKEFVDGMLFLPDDLMKQINDFFQKTLELIDNFEMSKETSSIKAEDRAANFKKAGEIAFSELPDILFRITEQSRLVFTANKIPGFRKSKQKPTAKLGSAVKSTADASQKSDNNDKIFKLLKFIANDVWYGTFFALVGLSYAFYVDNELGAAVVLFILGIVLFFVEGIRLGSFLETGQNYPWKNFTLSAGIIFIAVMLVNIIDKYHANKSVLDAFTILFGSAGLIMLIITFILRVISRRK